MKSIITEVKTVEHKDDTKTVEYTVVYDLNTIGVNLFYKAGETAPHGCEHFSHRDGGTSFYNEIGLNILNKELTDYDGVYFLPKAVARVLRHLGYTVGDECLSSPIVNS